jgi:hypothetical protein
MLIASSFLVCGNSSGKYKVESITTESGDYMIKLLDRFGEEMFYIYYDRDGNLVSVSVKDNKRSFDASFDFTEKSLLNFYIEDKKSNYSHLSNFMTPEVIYRQEIIDGFEVDVRADSRGAIITKSRRHVKIYPPVFNNEAK